MALTNQYAGNYKWEEEIKKQDDLLHMHIRSVEFPARGFYSPAQKCICFYAAMC